MTMDVQWYLEGHVIYIHNGSVLQERDLTEGNEKVVRLMRKYPDNNIILITNVLDVVSSHVSVFQLNELLTFAKEPNLKKVITIQNNRALSFLGTMFTQVMGLRYEFYPSLEQALQTLHEQMPQLDWDSAQDHIFGI